MARAPNEKVSKAYELYKQGYKLVDISKELNIPSSTVRRWKKTYNWDSERSDKNNERSLKQNNKKVKKKEPIAEEVKEVLKNTELTDKQRLFCIYYIKKFNATKAYQKAYGCSYETALVNGPRLLGNARIQEEVKSLKEGKLNRLLLSEEDIFQRYMDIAFSDIGDYLSFKKQRKNKWTKSDNGEDIPVINPDTGEQDYFEYNVVELNDSKELDTSILQEVSEGKDGVRIKLQDKMKALQWLADHMGIATDKQRAEIKVLESKIVNNEKSKEDKIDEYFGKLEECFKNA
ncbi:terminase small subunit [Clostridium sp. LY3-2]|uniref:terminase small subunit n=1 Tax=Clostridium sp. LY3-2 TaxID=2942482 RepID=UPI0021520E0D|nr:terminase small subunit [Clostridium sp. LY3-2]MCR6515311.1 terminase small subunit [Clostridium sp. LY3-2]